MTDSPSDNPPHRDRSKLSHLNEQGAAHMVDISAKSATRRTARARGVLRMSESVRAQIQDGQSAKGDIVATARIAGIMAAKQTSGLIPLCHPLSLSQVSIDFDWNAEGIIVTAQVSTTNATGVEMEALVAVSIALLTLYDMIKSIDKNMIISDIHLLSKSGGRSGDWQRNPQNSAKSAGEK